MRFLEPNEAAEWCRDRGGETGEYFRLLPDLSLSVQERVVWDWDGSTPDPSGILGLCKDALGDWQDCLSLGDRMVHLAEC